MSDADTAPMARAVLHDGWGELVLDRPQRRNALVGPMVTQLRAGLAELQVAGVRVILLRGEGGVFCSGLDVDAFAQRPAPAWRASWPEDWFAFHRDLHACPAVIVGALEKYAINGGASLAMACDLLVAGQGAQLFVGEAAQGMHAPMNIAWLTLRTTPAVAAQLALGALRTPATELHRLGLVYDLVADDEVAAAARGDAERLAGFPGQGLAAIKASLRKASLAAGEAVFDAARATDIVTAGPSRI